MKSWRLPNITGPVRMGFWILLLGLTSLIFLYHTHLSYEFQPIQSLHIFDNLPLFVALYYIWVALLLFLLFTPGKRDDHEWENVALVCLFSLVTYGFWVHLHQGYFGEVFVYAGSMEYTNTQGTMPDYLEFPGLPLLGSAVQLITGTQTFDAIAIILLIESVLFAALLYILFRNLSLDPQLSSVAVLLIVMGSSELAKYIPQFAPRGFALVLLILFLVVIISSRTRFMYTWQGKLLFMILLGVISMTHLITSTVMFLVLVGIYIIQQFGKDRLVTPLMLILCLVVILSWEFYYATKGFGSMIMFFPHMIDMLSQGDFLSEYFASMGRANLGGLVPLWALIIRYLLLALLLGVGSVVAIRNLVKVSKLDPVEKIATGGIIGIGLFFIISALLSGATEAVRVFLYLPLFAVPLALLFIFPRLGQIRKYCLAGVILFLLIISFPTFLVNNDRVRNSTFSSYEMSSGFFLSLLEESDQELTVYNSVNSQLVSYYAPEIQVEDIHYYALFTTGGGEAEFWQLMDDLVIGFKNPDPGRTHLFQLAGRSIWPFQFTYGIDPTTRPQWQVLEENLDQENKIYDNSFVQLYRARGEE